MDADRTPRAARPLSLRQQRRHDLAGLATRVRELLAGAGELVPVKTADVTLRARRPQYCALSNAKLASVGIPMSTWDDAVERYLRSLGLIG